MHIIIWEYQVKLEKGSEFERVYSPNGAWARLFKNGSGFLGTELLQSDQKPDVYVTIDRWDSRESYETFLAQWKAEYNQLDEQCEGMTVYEKRINSFLQVTG
jgi:heme-degrading monooxygenase HmoA